MLKSLVTALSFLSTSTSAFAATQCDQFAMQAAESIMAMNNEIADDSLALELIKSDQQQASYAFRAYRYELRGGSKVPVTPNYLLSVRFEEFAPGAGNCVLNQFIKE